MGKEKFRSQDYIELVYDCLAKKCSHIYELDLNSLVDYCMRKIEAINTCDEDIIREIIDTSIGMLVVGGSCSSKSDRTIEHASEDVILEGIAIEDVLLGVTDPECDCLLREQENRVKNFLDYEYECCK